jgi:serine protease inhibitor
MPVDLNEDVKLVLASALAVKLKWREPFDEGSRMVSDQWVRWLTRSDHDLSSVRRHVSASAGPLTAITVLGAGEIDVRLVIGEPGRTRSDVLAAAIQLQGEGQDGAEILAGRNAPGVEVIESMSPTPSVILSMPHFEIEEEHDLLDQAEVFGLVSATDRSRGHFPGLSPEPLAVSQAKQAVLARFSATGFEAAAVTAIAWLAGSAPTRGAKALLVSLDRPFAFVAVHRPTGIPLVAGWVTESAYQRASDELA